MGKRIQYTGTMEEKQPSCAFRTDFGTKRYVYPSELRFAQQIPQGDANPLRRYRARGFSLPLGEGGCDQREQTEGAPSNKNPPVI